MKEEKQLVGFQKERYPRIRVSQEAYDLIAEYANETNITMNDIASAVIEEGIKYLSIRKEMVPVMKLYIGDKEI